MNELLTDARFTLAVLGVLMAVFGWIARDHHQRVKNLEREAVRKEDLEQLRSDFADRHRENSSKFTGIEQGVIGIHDRIDDLYRDLINRRGS